MPQPNEQTKPASPAAEKPREQKRPPARQCKRPFNKRHQKHQNRPRLVERRERDDEENGVTERDNYRQQATRLHGFISPAKSSSLLSTSARLSYILPAGFQLRGER